jgi:hypothetical protein
MPTVSELKERSGAKLFASFIGRSKIAKNTHSYKMIEVATMILLRQGFGVIHGGFAGGAMLAVSEAADVIIAEKNLLPEFNIAVPQLQFDHLPRVSGAVFTDSANDIFDRLRVILSGDIIIVSPSGALGTDLELSAAIHENIYCQYFKQSAKPKPIIFLQATRGTDWKQLLITKSEMLGLERDLSSYDWLYFIYSKEDLNNLLVSLKNNLLAESF